MYSVTNLAQPVQPQHVNLEASAYRVDTEDDFGVEYTVTELATMVSHLSGRDLTRMAEALEPTAAMVLRGAL